MILMPDTNAWIKLLNPGNNTVKDRFIVTEPRDVRLCSVVKAVVDAKKRSWNNPEL